MLPALLGLFFTSGAKAEPIPGLNAVGYSVSAIPPIKSDTEYPTCGSETENNINRNFNGEPFQQCPVDYFMIHYTGFITIPANNTIQFMIAADDGGTIQIGDTEFGTWNNKGCSWSEQTTAEFPANTYALDGWLYEDGGETCFMLAWNINNTGWEIVPDSAFTTNGVPTTTTTIQETTTTWQTTTVPQTSTTVAVTTSLAASTTVAASTTDVTTTVPVTSTSVVETSTTTTSTTTTTVFVPTQTTSTIVYIVPETTTTTTEPEVTTTTQEVTTTVETTIPEETTTSTTETPSQTSLEPVTEVQTSAPSTTVETTIQTLLEPPTEDIDVIELPNSSEEVAIFINEVLNNPDQLSQLSTEQVVEAITQVLDAGVTSEQAVAIVSNPEVLESITQEQAEELFEQIDVSELTVEAADELVEVLNEAPTKVKKAFQETINVFSGLFNSYKMVGQNIPVGERRTLLAVTNVMMVSGVSVRRRAK